MIGQRHEIARLQSDFYRDQYRKILRWILGSILIIYLLMVVVLYLIFFQPTQHYYANTSEGKILAMPAAKT